MGLVILCPILVHFGRVWIPRAWGDLRFVNYFVAFIPTILSILFAFVIDKDLAHHMKKMWRLGIITCGILYSVALWHQQQLTDKSNLETQTAIVNDAVTQSNKHSDANIGPISDDVKSIKQGLAGTASKSDLSKTANAITNSVAKSQAELNVNVKKIGKPDPPEQVRLQFGLFAPDTKLGSSPILTRAIDQNKDGSYVVDVFFTNISNVAGEAIDIWIFVCDVCSFAVEPQGFDSPAGQDEHIRHRVIPLLNPGVSFEKQTITIKSSIKPPFNFGISFKYSCKACGSAVSAVQLVRVVALPYAAAVSSLYSRLARHEFMIMTRFFYWRRPDQRIRSAGPIAQTCTIHPWSLLL